MRIFMGNGPWAKPGYYGVRAGSRWPHFEKEGDDYMPFPFFLAYGAAVLEEDGFDVLLVDAIAEKRPRDWFLERIEDFQPALIVLEVSTISIDTDLKTIQAVRDRVGGNAKIALCGLHSPMYSPEFLVGNPFVDSVMIGEYERTLLDLARSMREGGPRGPIEGLLHRSADGDVVAGGPRPVVSELDSLPWPARHQLPMLNYHDEPGNIPRPSVQMWASRGCPYQCSFCAWPQIMYGGNQYRTRNPVDVVDEMEWLIRECGFRSVYFDDDTFNIGKKRLKLLCSEIRRRRLDTPWAAMARADLMDRALLEDMRSAGMEAVKYGVESASQAVVDGCGKRLDLEKARRGIELTEELGIKHHLTFMFGLPGETRETAARTVDMALGFNAESAQFTIATPFPGSSFFEQMKQEGRLLEENYACYDGYHRAVIRTDGLTAQELEEIVADVRRRFDRRRRLQLPMRSFSLQRDVPLVSVVIPHLQGGERLRACLDSVLEQDYRSMEIVLVDSGSEDNSTVGIEQEYPSVRIVPLDRNKGFAHAVNSGIRASAGHFVALINDDLRLRPGWVANMVHAISQSGNIGSCASTVLRADDSSIVDSAGLGLTRLGHSFNLRAGSEAARLPQEPRSVFGPCAAAAIYRRELFERIGDFDEQFESYVEDVDIALRARLHGYDCLHVPQAVAVHDGAATTGGQYSQYMVEKVARNTLWLLLKSMPRSILEKNLPRLGLYFLSSQLFHGVKTRRGVAHLKGLSASVKGFRAMVASRKTVLGARRVDDTSIMEHLRSCEEELLLLGTSRWKRRTLSLLHRSSLKTTTT